MAMYRLCLIFNLALITCFSSAQAPPSIQQALAANGIGASREELREALHSPKADVRGMAAMQLAEDKDKSSIRLLEESLRKEQNTLTQLNISRALLILGDSMAQKELVELCGDLPLPKDIRIQAANDLLGVGNNACFAAIAEMLGEADQPGAQLSLLNYLNHAPNADIPSQTTAVLVLGLEKLLTDNENVAEVRRSSADCMVRYLLLEAVPLLRQTAADEKDPATKQALQRAEHELVSPKSMEPGDRGVVDP